MSREYPCVYWDNGICQKHTDAESLSYCVMGPCPDETPSRADYIRSMTDEEMAA